jgi:hypothetical protein
MSRIMTMVLVGTVVLAACSNSGTQGGDKTTTGCSVPAQVFLTSLQEGFHEPLNTASIDDAKYFKTANETVGSNKMPIYEVAVKVGGKTMVFGTDTDPTKDESGLIIAANDEARSSSDWGTVVQPGSPVDKAYADPGTWRR